MPRSIRPGHIFFGVVHFRLALKKVFDFLAVCFGGHCKERGDMAISKQMLGITIFYKPTVYNSLFCAPPRRTAYKKNDAA